jgi:hypothetical protein
MFSLAVRFSPPLVTHTSNLGFDRSDMIRWLMLHCPILAPRSFTILTRPKQDRQEGKMNAASQHGRRSIPGQPISAVKDFSMASMHAPSHANQPQCPDCYAEKFLHTPSVISTDRPRHYRTRYEVKKCPHASSCII